MTRRPIRGTVFHGRMRPSSRRRQRGYQTNRSLLKKYLIPIFLLLRLQRKRRRRRRCNRYTGNRRPPHRNIPTKGVHDPITSSTLTTTNTSTLGRRRRIRGGTKNDNRRPNNSRIRINIRRHKHARNRRRPRRRRRVKVHYNRRRRNPTPRGNMRRRNLTTTRRIRTRTSRHRGRGITSMTCNSSLKRLNNARLRINERSNKGGTPRNVIYTRARRRSRRHNGHGSILFLIR